MLLKENPSLQLSKRLSNINSIFFFLHLICALRLLLGKTGLILFSITGNWQNSFWGSESNHHSGSPLRLSLSGCDVCWASFWFSDPYGDLLLHFCFIFLTLTHSTITAYRNGWVLHSVFLWESFFHVTGNVVQVYNPGEGFFYSSWNGNNYTILQCHYGCWVFFSPNACSPLSYNASHWSIFS